MTPQEEKAVIAFLQSGGDIKLKDKGFADAHCYAGNGAWMITLHNGWFHHVIQPERLIDQDISNMMFYREISLEQILQESDNA